jgi:Predicted helicase
MSKNLEKGKLLEYAVKLYLKDEGFDAYSWQEWASQKGFEVKDTGIDLVAEKDGQYYAVQCKNWNKKVSWNDLGPFIGSLFPKDFEIKGGFLVATSITNEVEKKIEEIKKPIVIIPVEEVSEYLEKAQADLEGKPIIKEKKELRPYQELAVKSVLEGFQSQ